VPLPMRFRLANSFNAASFDDLTGTVLAGHHQPLRVWVLCLYFMGLNLSNRQIAGELGLCAPDVQVMTEQLRRGLIANTPAVELTGEVDEGSPSCLPSFRFNDGDGPGSRDGSSWIACRAGHDKRLSGLASRAEMRFQGL